MISIFDSELKEKRIWEDEERAISKGGGSSSHQIVVHE
jgi:hypothetical protein